jgi:hypothetical protein
MSKFSTKNPFQISAILIEIVACLQLDGLTTKKPRLTRYTMKPTVVSIFLQIIS